MSQAQKTLVITRLDTLKVVQLSKLTKWEKENLGMEDELEDSSSSINRIVMETESRTLTKEDIVCESRKDPVISQVMEYVKMGRLSQQLKDTPYGDIL